MISHYAWYLRLLARQVWVRVASFALLALLTVGLARVLAPYLPDDLGFKIGADAVDQLLNVLTASMLAVTTFSLSIAVSAFADASASATPRAAVLLQQDRTTQNVLATFLGAFVFGFVGLIVLNAEVYSASGRVVVFSVTVLVIGLVVIALIRWIDHLMTFGRIGNTLDRVEAAAMEALEARLNDPYLGGVKREAGTRVEGFAVLSRATGYVQHIEMKNLQDCAEAIDARVHLLCLPGTFVTVGERIIVVEAATVTKEQGVKLCDAVALGKQRTFDGDPRFGMIVMAEIASRALSPGVNDPGTAIDILGRFVRILSRWTDRSPPDLRFSDVTVPQITAAEVIEDAFRPVARDGIALVEVQIRLHKALRSIGNISTEVFSAPTIALSQEALERAEAAGLLPSELAEIRAVAAKVDSPR
ncbi:MAG: DUF2254 domain-containing protein [Rhodobacterales bacterium]